MRNHVMPGHMDHEINMDRLSLPAWIGKILTKERALEISLFTITFTVLGLDLFVLYKALQVHTIVGTPYY